MIRAATPLVRQMASLTASRAQTGLRSGLQRFEATAAAAATAQPPTGPAPVMAYSKATSWLHWIMGAGILSCFSSVQGAMVTRDTDMKGKLMTIHKSSGLAVAALVLPRLAMALLQRRPGAVIGAPQWEHMVASATHTMLYAFMIILPTSGIAMGYYGGKGLPFYGYFTIPGAEKPNGAVAKTAFAVHKTAGLFFEYLTPIHIGAAVMHALKGQKIFQRINPFRLN